MQHDYCVGALANRLGVSDAAVSQHLRILRKGELVKGEKRGYWTHYVVEREALNQAADSLRQFAAMAADRENRCPRESSGTTNVRAGKTLCKCRCEHRIS